MSIISQSKELASYINAWWSTDYALPLMVRHTYEAGIEKLAEIPIPWFQGKAVQLRKPEVRYKRLLQKQKAIHQMKQVLYNS